MGISTKDQRRIAMWLWDGRTMGDVDKAVAVAEAAGCTWAPIGHRPNNRGPIEIGTNPGLTLVERLTNAFDAMIEMAHELGPKPLASPEAAAQAYYGVPAAGLSEISPKLRSKLSENIVVSLDDSGNIKRPSVLVHDRAMGQHPTAMPTTLLSLNEQNKVDKPHTMGTYGQGGGASYSFSKATTMLSRRHPKLLGGLTDLVGWTIVMKRFDGTMKVPSYQYLVGATGEVLTLDPALFASFEHGVRIVHVEYDLQLPGPFTTQPYQFFQAALPSPILPFTLRGTRSNDTDSARTIVGNAARLANAAKAKGEIEVPYSERVAVQIAPYGEVVVRYWVVRRPEDSEAKGDPTASYVEPSSAIGITLHGQRQDSEPRAWINHKAKLPFLHKNLIIQIEADALTPEAKAELFASTRERARKCDVRTAIFEELAQQLRADGRLTDLDAEERERLMRKRTSAASEKVRQRLAKYIKHVLEGTTKPGTGMDPGAGERTGEAPKPAGGGGGGGGGPRRTTDDSELNEIPTWLQFDKEHLKVRQGGRAVLWVYLDAKNDYLPDHDSDLAIAIDGGSNATLAVVSRGRLAGGWARWVVQANAEAETGEYKLTASLTVGKDELIDMVTVEVVEAPARKKGATRGSEPETGPQVEWIYEEDWTDDFNSKVVGRAYISDTSTTILVNRDYDVLVNALNTRGLTKDAIDSRAERYLFPVACGLWRQEYAAGNLDDESEAPSEAWRLQETQRMAEVAVLTIMSDLDTPDDEDG